jgi:hypothetical protein
MMPIPVTAKQHAPWRGIDDQEYVVCPARGITPLDRQDYGLFCGGCGFRIGNATGRVAYRETKDANDEP